MHARDEANQIVHTHLLPHRMALLDHLVRRLQPLLLSPTSSRQDNRLIGGQRV
jgi:hypothetical protein